MVDNQCGKLVNVLRTNGGGEFNSVDFDEFCIIEGIMHEVRMPYTLKHNGVTERRNMIIMNMAKSMLKAKRLLSNLWGEAVTIVMYLFNRCLTNSLHKKFLKKSSLGRGL